MPYSCISFTTDYGLVDGFVAACHGVAATIAPQARLIDVTHLVPRGDVRRGALVLAQTVPYLPRDSVHVAVVDPGVGTSRRAVAIETEAGALVGPDNGLLTAAAEALGGVRRAAALVNDKWFLHPVSHTFHGRDVFSSIAGHLCRGADLGDLGPAVPPSELTPLPSPVLRRGERWLEAEVLAVDTFGNVQLPADERVLGAVGAAVGVRVSLSGQVATRAVTFGSVPLGELVLYVDSAGLAAAAVNGGSAAERLGVGVGDVVRLTVHP
jgi:S-adenosyl-L-methionine hydrolase (adenosine-forming)